MEQTNRIPNLVPPGDARLNGKTYEQWAAAWWRWCLEMPLTNSAGVIHPSYDESSPFDVTESHANFLWCTRKDRPLKPLYEQLKKNGILVRYMNYPGWSDGLRISVGSDEQIDAMLVVLTELLESCS